MLLTYQTPYYENESVAREAIWGSPTTIYLIILFSFVGLFLWIAAYIYVTRHIFKNENSKILWLIIVVLSGLVGLESLVSYLFNGLFAGFPT